MVGKNVEKAMAQFSVLCCYVNGNNEERHKKPKYGDQ
jgi:hypothetical protein